jgi:hypothetical protein
VLTSVYREKRARALLAAGALRARELAREWLRGKPLDAEGKEALRHTLAALARRGAGEDLPKLELVTVPLFGVARGPSGKAQGLPEQTTQWHASRAKGKLELFDRVEDCGNDRRVLTMVCRGCSYTPPDVIPIGCSSQYFCPNCQARIAKRFQKDFMPKRVGLRSWVERAGLCERRNRKRIKGGRFGERLITFTLPHWGGVLERIETLRETWPVFKRSFDETVGPRLSQIKSGIFTVDDARFDRKTGELQVFRKKGEKKADEGKRKELTYWDLVQHFRVFEWTIGGDELGNPHFHWWVFSQYLDQLELQKLWTLAFCKVTGHRFIEGDPNAADLGERYATVARLRDDGTHADPTPGPSVDVRTAEQVERDGTTIEKELIKYLTKTWEVGDAGDVSRVSPEVFAKVYEALDGTRRRQSSAGFSRWALAKFDVCPKCGHDSERGHWAHIAIELNRKERERWALHSPEHGEPPRPVAIGPPRSIADREAQHWAAYELARTQGWPEAQVWFVELLGAELRAAREGLEEAAREAQREQDWLNSTELRLVQARWNNGAPLELGEQEGDELARRWRRWRSRRGQ